MDHDGLKWVDIGNRLFKLRGKVPRVVVVMDIIELNEGESCTEQNERRRVIGHNDPNYYPFKVADKSTGKNMEMYQLRMVTHTIREKTWKFQGIEGGSFFTELFLSQMNNSIQ